MRVAKWCITTAPPHNGAWRWTKVKRSGLSSQASSFNRSKAGWSDGLVSRQFPHSVSDRPLPYSSSVDHLPSLIHDAYFVRALNAVAKVVL